MGAPGHAPELASLHLRLAYAEPTFSMPSAAAADLKPRRFLESSGSCAHLIAQLVPTDWRSAGSDHESRNFGFR